ncbi:MAG: hypothetical protein RBS78_00820, partial [Coriobacteriia bacterium]|nr:hypothetical protein [Coriobacteriia bacterium]
NILDPTDPEVLASIDITRHNAKASTRPLALSRCDACDKVLEDTEKAIRGYASGEKLGLCRKCASYVNTREAIDAAEKAGHTVHSPVINAPSGDYYPPMEEDEYA